MAQSPLSSNHASVTDADSLFVIDRTADKPGTVCSDDSGPDIPVNDAVLPSSEQVSNQKVETGSINTTENSPLSNEIDQHTNPVPTNTGYKSPEKVKLSMD